MEFDKLIFESEENCSNCLCTFCTETVTSNCPECGDVVVSCNSCKHWRDNPEKCDTCFKGSKHHDGAVSSININYINTDVERARKLIHYLNVLDIDYETQTFLTEEGEEEIKLRRNKNE